MSSLQGLPGSLGAQLSLLSSPLLGRREEEEGVTPFRDGKVQALGSAVRLVAQACFPICKRRTLASMAATHLPGGRAPRSARLANGYADLRVTPAQNNSTGPSPVKGLMHQVACSHF